MRPLSEGPSNAMFLTELFVFNERIWPQIEKPLLEIDKQSFGDQTLSKESLKATFSNPDTMAVILRNPEGQIIGFTFAIRINGKTAHIGTTAIEQTYRGRKLGGKLVGTLEDEMLRRGYEEFTRDASKVWGDAIKRHYGPRIIESRDHDSAYGLQTFFRIKLRSRA